MKIVAESHLFAKHVDRGLYENHQLLIKNLSIQLDFLPGPAIFTDRDFAIVDINEKAKPFVNYREKKYGMPINDLLGLSKSDLNDYITYDSLNTNNFELINYNSNTTHYFRVNSSCIVNPDNSCGHLFIFFEDVYNHSKIKELEISRDFYKEILDNLPADIAVFDESQKYLYLNHHAIKNDEVRNWLIGKDDFDYCKFRNLPITIAQERRTKYEHFLKNKLHYYSFEETIERDDKSWHNLRIMHGIYKPNGEFKYALEYGLNIDQLKAYELKNMRQEVAIEISTDGIALLDMEGKYTYLNGSHIRMFGYKKESELLGKTWREFYDQDEIERIEREVFPVLIENKKWRGITRANLKGTNRKIYVELTLNLLPDGGMVCICRDYSDRKLQEETLRRLSLVAKQTASMVLITDPETRIEWANEAFEKTSGYLLTEVLGKKPFFLSGPETSSEVLERIIQSTETGTPFSGEKLCYKKDGTAFWVYLTSNPVFDDNGNIVNWVYVETDITPIKNAEFIIQQSLDKEKALGELKSQFVSMASHEFRTPLAGIMTSIELIKVILNKEKINYPTRIDIHLKRCLEEIERMTQIMDNVLLFGKIQSGKMPFKPFRQDIIAFLKNCVQNFELIHHNRTVITAIPDEQVMVNFDNKLMEHVIHNILNNAYKYSESESPIVLDFEELDESVNITITDRGIGIPIEEQNQLFSSFFRASNTMSYPGTGLGLGIVKQFIDRHSGTVTINSQINQGCSVTIKLLKQQ
jgi:PAS domain S-box-containing protein